MIQVDNKQKTKERTKVYGIYTIAFIIVSLASFYIFIRLGKSFIFDIDGLTAHIAFLTDLRDLVKDFLTSPEKGLPFFSWELGLGLDVIGQYSWPLLGDPFAYLTLLFKSTNLELAYCIGIILRMYFAGVSFIVYCRYHKIKNLNCILGAIIYTFSCYMFYVAARQPFFSNSFIVLPMILLGIDKLLCENKKMHFTFWIFIGIVINYYFFYMHTILAVIYAIIKYICEYRQESLKFFLNKLGSSVLCYITGIMISGIILLPTIYSFINSARGDIGVGYLYTVTYYYNLIPALITTPGPNWNFIGVSSIILLMIPVLFAGYKKHKSLVVYLVVATIMLLVPFLQLVMSGFSTPSGRWTYGYVFILSFIIAKTFNEKLEYNKKELKYMCIGFLIYVASVIAVCQQIAANARNGMFISLLYATIMLVIILVSNLLHKKPSNFNKYSIIIFIMIFLNIISNSNRLHDIDKRNYISSYYEYGKLAEMYETQRGANANFKKAINKVKEDETFYRVGKYPESLSNLSLVYDYKSIAQYLSIGSKYIYDLNEELEDNDYTSVYSMRGFSDRTKITTLLGTKYYISDNANMIPYGYKLNSKSGKTIAYENEYPLSVGVSYDSYMLREEYEKLSPLEKEDALLKTAVIETTEGLNGYDINKKEDLTHAGIKEVSYAITDDHKLLSNNKLKVETSEKNSIKLNLESNSLITGTNELYVYMENLKFTPYTKEELKQAQLSKNSTKYDKEKLDIQYKNYIPSTSYIIRGKVNGKRIEAVEIKDKTDTYYVEHKNILLNMRHYKEPLKEIELVFETNGHYEFDSLKVIAVSMEDYKQSVQNLQKTQLENIEYDNTYLKGTINVEKDSILQISTSYTSGWKAYVDGKEVETINVNTAFIGIPVQAGNHEIYFKYKTPYLYEGVAVTIIGVVMFSGIFIYEKRKNNKIKG